MLTSGGPVDFSLDLCSVELGYHVTHFHRLRYTLPSPWNITLHISIVWGTLYPPLEISRYTFPLSEVHSTLPLTHHVTHFLCLRYTLPSPWHITLHISIVWGTLYPPLETSRYTLPLSEVHSTLPLRQHVTHFLCLRYTLPSPWHITLHVSFVWGTLYPPLETTRYTFTLSGVHSTLPLTHHVTHFLCLRYTLPSSWEHKLPFYR
jgi:hypothetical protein